MAIFHSSTLQIAAELFLLSIIASKASVPRTLQDINIEVTVNEENVVSIGQDKVYTCRTLIGAPVWKFFPGGGQIEDLVFPRSIPYNQKGILIPQVAATAMLSTLTINGTPSTNNTRIKCAQYMGSFENETETLIFEVYGAPTSPTNLMASASSLGTLFCSWSPSFAAYSVPLSYQVEVTSEDSTQNRITLSTDSTSLLFQAQQPTCSPYQISVTALNAAGRSANTEINATLLSLNNTESISQTVEHRIELLGEEFLVEVSFQPPIFCNFSLPSYSLSLTLSTPQKTVEMGPFISVSSDSRFHLQLNSTAIPSNAVCNFVIFSGNFNISAKHTFYTTDVQNAILRVDYAQRAFEVTCIFMMGSKARGCYFTLKGTFGNYSDHILRENGSAVHLYSVERSLGKLTYSVYDWEEAGTVGGVAIPVQLMDATLAVDVPDPAELTESPSIPEFLPPTVAVVGVLIILLTIIILAFFIHSLSTRAHRSGSLEMSGLSGGSVDDKKSVRSVVAVPNKLAQEDELYDSLQHIPQARGSVRRITQTSPPPFSPPPPPPPSSPPPTSPPPFSSLPPSFAPTSCAPPPITPPAPPSSSPPSSIPSPSSPTPLLPQDFPSPSHQESHYAEVQQPQIYSQINEVPFYHVLEKPVGGGYEPNASPPSSCTHTPPLTDPPTTPPPPIPARAPSPHTYSAVIKGNRL